MLPTQSVFKWVLFFGLAASLPQNGIAEESPPDSLTAEQILARVATTYSSCKSYSDSGVVKTLYVKVGGNRTTEQPFTTAFIRPDRFRFEFRGRFQFQSPEVQLVCAEDVYIVWRRAKEVRTWWDVDKPHQQKPESLGLGLAGATGVSGGSAHRIPGLLLPDEVHGRHLTDLTDATRIEDARIGSVECMCIKGKCSDHPITLWIEKETFLVRRIDLELTFSDFRAETTTTYNPVINAEVSDKMLEFNPPEQKRE